ncbi:MAG: methionine adenosyltransferase domain-containing protein, partial [Kiritimatiellae bacterium]|nr:methionine adenosyltransferase domain-containing protein [Kiritimatiellia bacterium]
EEKAVAMLESGEVFDFRPGRLVAALGLLAPNGWTYRDTASGGHFGRAAFPWERLDRVDAVRAALGLR